MATGASALERLTVRSYFKGDTQYADILLEDHSFLTLASNAEHVGGAHERAVMAVEAIHALEGQNRSLRELVPDIIEGRRAVARVGSLTIFEVTEDDARVHQIPKAILAYEWCNRIRQELGSDMIPEPYVDYLIYKDRLGGNRISLQERDGDSWEVGINGKTVMRFARSNYNQAALATAMIQDAVLTRVSGKRILPSVDNTNAFGGKINGKPFFSVNENDVLVNRAPTWRLAMDWVDNVRTSLGFSKVSFHTVTSAYSERGKASWYGEPFHGRRAASGERYDMFSFSAAHKSLPFGSELLVTRLDTHEQMVVRVNDRGPYVRGRIIDLSLSAARALGMSGVAPVRIDVIGRSVYGPSAPVQAFHPLPGEATASLTPKP